MATAEGKAPDKIELPLYRDVFLRTLLRELSGTLEDVVGIDDASGFVSVVGQRVGDWILTAYREELGTAWSKERVGEVLVDLKRRIEGDFRVSSIDDEKIVLENRACPFGDKVVGRQSLCMMTSNVFGHITAENLGYARVELEETIAAGAEGCRVVVHLRAAKSGESTPGCREYYASAGGDENAKP